MTDIVDPFEEDELSEGEVGGGHASSVKSELQADLISAEGSDVTPRRSVTEKKDLGASPSESIIKTPEDVPAALERVTKKAEPLYDRARVDREWLLRRAGKKK